MLTFRICTTLAFLTAFGLMFSSVELGGVFAGLALAVEAVRLGVAYCGSRL